MHTYISQSKHGQITNILRFKLVGSEIKGCSFRTYLPSRTLGKYMKKETINPQYPFHNSPFPVSCIPY